MGKDKEREKEKDREKERDPAPREPGRPGREMFTDTRRVRELIKLMADHELVELELVEEHSKIKLKRSDPHRPPPPTPQPHTSGHVASLTNVAPPPTTIETGADEMLTVRSPMVGTFYSAANPETGPYVTIGTNISEDTVVCIIEAMKVFNEIRAEVSGVVAKVLVQNGQAVEFNQPLFLLKP